MPGTEKGSHWGRGSDAAPQGHLEFQSDWEVLPTSSIQHLLWISSVLH